MRASHSRTTSNRRKDIHHKRHEQTSMSKIAQNLAKEEKSMLAKIRDKEIESATILDEIARLDIDRLNTQERNSQLEEKLNEELVARKDNEGKMDEQEGEIHRRNDEIEKRRRYTHREAQPGVQRDGGGVRGRGAAGAARGHDEGPVQGNRAGNDRDQGPIGSGGCAGRDRSKPRARRTPSGRRTKIRRPGWPFRGKSRYA
mmetsp:Transcript_20812/g.44564  ORF Transcript_20812/g.44564 Transcript_20812/m.44564 type:complete len:201 (+) Transcript_20812:256-858(+)